MGFRIIQVTLGLEHEQLQALEFGPELRSALLSAKGEPRPVVFLVREDDVPRLMADCTDLIVDREEKHAKRTLQSYLVGRRACRGKIPLIRASFAYPSNARRNVRELLTSAREAGETTLYVVAFDDGSFEHFFKEALPAIPPPDPLAQPRQQLFPSKGGERLTTPVPNPEIHKKIEWAYVGESQAAKRVKQRATKASDSPENILIEGPTGSGKEVLAKVIHEASGRPGKLEPVNCGAISIHLFEAAMFGADAGAYTDAKVRKDGHFHRAHLGTLFLDEVQDLPLELQGKLLRVLEDGVVTRVGATRGNRLDVRIISATNKDLRARVAAGDFREDLYHRLRVIEIVTPALRDIREDIPLLVLHLLAQIPGTDPSAVLPEVLEEFCRHDWPGNVRQLRNFLKSLRVQVGPNLTVEAVRAWLAEEDRQRAPAHPGPAATGSTETFCDRSDAHIRRADKAIRAARIPLRGVSAPVPAPEAGVIIGKIRSQWQVLDELCETTVDFAGEFKSVQSVKHEIAVFLQMFPDRQAEALAYWKRVLDPLCDATSLALTAALGRVAAMRTLGTADHRAHRIRLPVQPRKRNSIPPHVRQKARRKRRLG